MPRPPDERRRRELVDALIAAFADGGVGGRSLRDIAAAVGTSHRMLLHHFGTRDELLLTIVEEVERRQTTVLTDLPDDPAAAIAAMWADVRRPAMRPFERLFFECYARAAQGEAPFTRLLPGAVDGWLAQVDEVSGGTVDRAMARLGLAVTRGLLLDLVATGDDAGVDAALAEFVALVRAAREPDGPEGTYSGHAPDDQRAPRQGASGAPARRRRTATPPPAGRAS